MEGPLKELAKLEKLTATPSPKGKSPSVIDSLDALHVALLEAKESAESGPASVDTLAQLTQVVEAKKKEIDERQKEVYSAVARLGKALDKVRAFAQRNTPHLYEWKEILRLVASPRAALVYLSKVAGCSRTHHRPAFLTYGPIRYGRDLHRGREAVHYPQHRTHSGQESGVDIPGQLRAQFLDLHRILSALRREDIGPALECVIISLALIVLGYFFHE